MIKDYFLNFWSWYYFVKSKDIVGGLFRYWMYILGALNVVPMLSNLFVPLYQDYSIIGRFMSLVIRVIWGFGGLVIFLVAGVPILILSALYFLLPFLIIVQLIRFFI